MLTFRLDTFFWVAETHLPSWAGFQDRTGAYGTTESKIRSDGTVQIVFAPEGRDTSPLTEQDLASVQWVIDNEEIFAASLLEELRQQYPKIIESFGYSKEERRSFAPNVTSTDDFRSLIGLHTVNVHPLIKNGIPYVGYEFGCSWDAEHGLGVLMHGTRVISIGGSDTAILLWIAKADFDNGRET